MGTPEQNALQLQISKFGDGCHYFTWYGYHLYLVKRAWGEIVISLQGGQVLLFRPVGEQPVLWVSDSPKGAPGAIRGGVPICWPWFADHPDDPSQPAHGVARTAQWVIEYEDVDDVGGRWVLIPQESLRVGLQLKLEIRIASEELTLALTSENSSDQPIAVSQALHSYFSISDISQVEIQGLNGCIYLDKLKDMQQSVLQQSLQFAAETDSIFENDEGKNSGVLIVDHGWRRVVSVNKRGGQSTVIWNPGASAATMSDVGMSQMTGFVCVEAARTRFFDDICLASGQAVTLETSVKVLPYPVLP